MTVMVIVMVIFKRFDTSLITLNSSNQVQLSGDLSLPTSNTQYIRFPNCNIRQGVATIVYFDFNVDTATGQYRFFIDSNTILNLTPLTTTISNTLQVNTINTNGDNDLVIRRNGSDMIHCGSFTGGGETYELIDVQAGSRFSSYHLYTNRLVNRTASFDTFFEGSNADGSGHVEYMRWNYTDQSLDFNAPIDNTNIAVIGNIVDTTISDERLKN